MGMNLGDILNAEFITVAEVECANLNNAYIKFRIYPSDATFWSLPHREKESFNKEFIDIHFSEIGGKSLYHPRQYSEVMFCTMFPDFSVIWYAKDRGWEWSSHVLACRL